MKTRELAVKIGNRFVAIQETEEGYDYTIYDEEYMDLDGGVGYEDLTMKEALNEIIDDMRNGEFTDDVIGDIDGCDPEEIDYEHLMELVDEANEI